MAPDELVWYAAYGSNLSRERFDIYLKGGTPAGAAHDYPGCRDDSAPRDDRSAELALELHFGGTSQTWGGGVAFVRRGAGIVKARLYLVTREQISDVLAQENWLDPGAVDLPRGDGTIGPYMYGIVLDLGDVDGHPVRTVTQSPDTEATPPTPEYLAHIATGLREAHGMTDEEISTYLKAAT